MKNINENGLPRQKRNELKEKYTKEVIALKSKIGKLEAERDRLADEVAKLRKKYEA